MTHTQSPRLRIVTGKGGVGKTVVATAVALAEARAGKRVLLAEVNAHNRVAALLRAKPVGSEMREVLENLYVVDMNPHDAIHEYALLTIHFEAIYKAVFENRLVKHFLRFIPSLGEMVMLGKIWFHEQEQLEDRPRFDTIVLDAPATGHAISMLRTPSGVEKVVPPGPMRENARIIRELLSDRTRTCMHIVTLPEEMPVNEARELEQSAQDVLNIAIGQTIINQRIEPLPANSLEALQTTNDSELRHQAVQTLRIREGKREAGEEHLKRLPARMLNDSVSLPRLVGKSLGPTEVEKLADILSASLNVRAT